MRAASNSLWWRLHNGLGWVLCPSQNSPAPCARRFNGTETRFCAPTPCPCYAGLAREPSTRMTTPDLIVQALWTTSWCGQGWSGWTGQPAAWISIQQKIFGTTWRDKSGRTIHHLLHCQLFWVCSSKSG